MAFIRFTIFMIMIPLYVMTAGILVARGVGTLWWPPLDDWQAASRAGLALMFVFTGMAHFTGPRADLVAMVPPRLPFPGPLVTVTGLAELAGAVALVVPAVSRLAAYGLMALLVVMFPANIYAARTGHTIAGRPHSPLRFARSFSCCGSVCCGGRYRMLRRPDGSGHSIRRTSTGSTREARRAGAQLATSATVDSTATEPTRLTRPAERRRRDRS